jgi:hypothetical protein
VIARRARIIQDDAAPGLASFVQLACDLLGIARVLRQQAFFFSSVSDPVEFV